MAFEWANVGNAQYTIVLSLFGVFVLCKIAAKGRIILAYCVALLFIKREDISCRHVPPP